MMKNLLPIGLLLLIIVSFSLANDEVDPAPFWSEWPVEIHGFVEGRAGTRLYNDPYQKEMSILESRLQLDVSAFPEWGDVVVKGDAVGDAVLEAADFDLREANVALSPLDDLELKVGRQILTWGTGEFLFINDMFPKDWQSFFIGRDTEYLKAPSDAVKAGLFLDWFNVDVAYTPKFDPDRFLTRERISYWNGNSGAIAGRNAIVSADGPDDWFGDDEVAVRTYKTIKGYEMALYGYWGYWKSPGGQRADGVAVFPDLNVYGASIRGSVGPGIGHAEIGYYDSTQDRSGTNRFINNSEWRYLIGYTQELAQDFTGGLQYYVEQMLHYEGYLGNLPGGPARDDYRHVLTLQLTKLLMDQNLRLSIFSYYSPSDRDGYLRPNANYKASDNLALEIGANIFDGRQTHTFFGQLHYNTNLYGAVRLSF